MFLQDSKKQKVVVEMHCYFVYTPWISSVTYELVIFAEHILQGTEGISYPTLISAFEMPSLTNTAFFPAPLTQISEQLTDIR